VLQAHFDELERSLLAASKVPGLSGHSIHKGLPREAFIRKFLEAHLNERIAVGTGEVLDANSRPRQFRNQLDLVLYKKEFPKISFGPNTDGGQINAFFSESVVATIEVKSLLTAIDIQNAMVAARRLKKLERHLDTSFVTGYIPPSILSYVVAYEGPSKMKTVFSWIQRAQRKLRIPKPRLGQTGAERYEIPSASLDGVFVLGKGFLFFDNSPMGFVTPDLRSAHPDRQWVLADSLDGNLLLLFLMLNQAASGLAAATLNPIPYLPRLEKPILFL
jgi:hypothetical protein